jgi:hypothetical protein
LPVALPLYSSLVILLPEKWIFNQTTFKSGFIKAASSLIHVFVLLIVIIQATLFVNQDMQIINATLHEADNNPRIQFYDQTLKALSPIPDEPLSVYYDYRLYVPETSGWTTQTTYDLLEYSYIQENNFEILLLLEQRIRDYLNPNVTGVDPDVFMRNQQFYRDADSGTINGYQLVFRNNVGLVYIREDLYQKYFQN